MYLFNVNGVAENKNHVIVDGESYPLTKTQKHLVLTPGQEVVVTLTEEYPEGCDDNQFCDGDETCIICLMNNRVAIVKP